MPAASVDREAVLNALRKVQDPDLHRDIVSLGFIKDLAIADGHVSFKVELTTPACPVKDRLREECTSQVEALPGVKKVSVEMTANTRGPQERDDSMLPGVRNLVAVASGKGGVGKSTVASNLALALQLEGARVGLLDADVYGPSMPTMFGVSDPPPLTADRRIIPLEGHGIRLLSVGLLGDPDQPAILRGPMVHRILQSFVTQVEWGELDYLIIDLPPGTGDAQLSLSQILAVSGAIIVTTPQDVSLIDARKGLATFRELKVPVLGIVENMSFFQCPHCSERTEIFRHGGGRRTAEELAVPFLGEIPIDPAIVVGGDSGTPIVVADPESPASRAYMEVAGRVAAALSVLSIEDVPDHPPILPGRMEWK